MHELGIVFHVIKSVEKIGEENGLTNVASVTLELGEVSGAIPHELERQASFATVLRLIRRETFKNLSSLIYSSTKSPELVDSVL